MVIFKGTVTWARLLLLSLVFCSFHLSLAGCIFPGTEKFSEKKKKFFHTHGNLARITVLRPKMLSGILAGSESFRSKALKDAFAVIFKVRFHLYCISDPSPRFRHAPSQNCTFPALSFGYQGQWMNLLPGGWEGRVKAWRERKERGKRCVLNTVEMLKHSLLKRFLGQRA